MATNSLTKSFIHLRNGAKANRNLHMHHDNASENSDNGLLGSGDISSSSKFEAQLPPEWVDKMGNVTADARRIESKLTELSALRTKRLMVNFETDEAQQDREIDMKTREITDLFHHAEGLLRVFDKQRKDTKISKSEATVITNMQRSQAKKLQGLNMSFKSAQKEYMNRRQIQMSGGGAQIFSVLDEDSNNEMPDDGWNDTQLAKATNMTNIVNERDVEIVKIAKSIEELAEIFKELAVMVIDQGTILDRIDFNMESAVDNATVAVTNLKKAEEHQKNALPMKCIIALVALIAIMLIVLIVKNTPKSN